MGEGNNKKKEDLKIDYENIDVEDIMKQIKEKIASQPRSSEPEQPVQPECLSAQTSFLPQPGRPPGKRTKIKRVMLKIFKPVAPIIKFLVLPVHQELKDTIQNLHGTNQRIDF